MIKDTVKTQTINGVKIPELEGKVKIELFNAKTGELEQKVEGKNIVTNAVADIFASNSFGAMDYSLVMPIYKRLFGGILCYESTITENADNYWLPPTTNNLIAHAGQTTYAQASDDPKRGNPNDVESSAVTNGFKWVWDFASTQGNGTISALAMCPPNLGDWWLDGNGARDVSGAIAWLVRDTQVGTYNQNANGIAPLFIVDRFGYAFYYTPSGVTIRKYKNYGNVTDIGFTEYAPSETHLQASSDYTDYEYTISNSSRARAVWADSKINIIVPNTDTISVYMIDPSTMAMTTRTMSPTGCTFDTTNTMIGTAYLNVPYVALQELDSDGYLYMKKASANTFYKIKWSTSTVSDVDADFYIDGRNGCISLGNWVAFRLWDNYQNIYYVTDGNVVKKLYMRYTSDNNSNAVFTGLSSSPAKFVENWYNAQPRFILFEMFLSTIKNLSTPVTKSSTQTMKITYTITEVQGE